MDKKRLIEELVSFGLSTKESQVYLAALNLGSFSIDSIAHVTKIKRPTCYFIVYNLMNKGLISRMAGSAKSIYIAEHPRNIATHIRKNLFKAEQLATELEKQSVAGQKPIVKLYTGQGGIEQIYEDMIQHKDTNIKALVDTASLMDRTGSFFLKDWIALRKSKNVSIQSLISSAQSFPYLTNEDELRQSKMIPDDIKLHGSIGVYDNKVIYLSNTADDFGIVVDNKAFAKMIESIFDYIWHKN